MFNSLFILAIDLMLLFSILNHSKFFDFSIPVKSEISLLLISNLIRLSGKFSIFFILLF